MSTLVLAEAPFGDLLSRAVLGALPALAGPGPLLLATGARQVPRGFAAVPPGPPPPGVARVLLAGPFLSRAGLEAALATAAAAVAAGADFGVHDLSLEGDAAGHAAPSGAGLLDRAAPPLRLRDHRSANILTLWRVAAPVEIAGYPEAAIAPDPALAAGLPAGKLLGLAIRDGEEMRRSWSARLPALRRLLAPWREGVVLPLPMAGPGRPGDDLAGTRAFAAAVLPDARLLDLPPFADAHAFHRGMTPARLKGLVAACAQVATNRDLPAAFAVACGVPVLGLAFGSDRRIVSCLATLANRLPPGSDLVHPRPGPG